MISYRNPRNGGGRDRPSWLPKSWVASWMDNLARPAAGVTGPREPGQRRRCAAATPRRGLVLQLRACAPPALGLVRPGRPSASPSPPAAARATAKGRSACRRKTCTWLNTNVRIGFTVERGHAWHYRTEDQGRACPRLRRRPIRALPGRASPGRRRLRQRRHPRHPHRRTIPPMPVDREQMTGSLWSRAAAGRSAQTATVSANRRIGGQPDASRAGSQPVPVVGAGTAPTTGPSADVDAVSGPNREVHHRDELGCPGRVEHLPVANAAATNGAAIFRTIFTATPWLKRIWP